METTKTIGTMSGDFLGKEFNEFPEEVQTEMIADFAKSIINDKGFLKLANKKAKNKRDLGFIKNVYVDKAKIKVDFYSTSWKHPGRTYYGVELKDIE